MATVIVEKNVVGGQADKDDVDVGALRVISGMCCAITSLYTQTPNCCGMQTSGTVLCIEGDCRLCKPAVNKEGQDERKVWCILADTDCVCLPPTTCIGTQCQFFCLDTRCAFPCNEKVPCIFNVWGLNCCYKFKCKPGCCKTLAQIDPETYSHEQELDAIPQANVGYGAPMEIEAER